MARVKTQMRGIKLKLPQNVRKFMRRGRLRGVSEVGELVEEENNE